MKMKIKKINENENKLLNRKEVVVEIENEKTPSKTEVLKILSEKFSISEDSIKINKIIGKFGINIFEVNANVYPSKEDKERIERKPKKESGKKGENKK